MLKSCPTLTRTLFLAVGAAIVAFAGPGPAAAQENSKLTDAAGTVEFEAPGKWRSERSDATLAASGFLGLIRARILVQVYAGTASPEDAGGKWKKTREAKGEVVHTAYEGDAGRWITRGKRTTEFVRTVAGSGKSAVAWVELKGPPSGLENDAFAILGTVRFVTAGAKPGGGAASGGAKEPETTKYKDPALRVEIALAGDFEVNRDAKKGSRRFVALRGTVGEDPAAYVDLYAFPEFDRVEAVSHWWQEAERKGWAEPLQIEGGHLDFRVLVHDRNWNRYVRLLPTKAGVYAIKVDADAESEKAVIKFLDSLSKGKGLRVLAELPETPRAPQGLKPLEHATHYVFNAAPAEKAEKVAATVALADRLVSQLVGLEPWEGRKGEVRILKDQEAYDAAVRSLGGKTGSAAFWSAEERAVITHGDALSVDTEGLLLALAREGITRRFGFRPPFWVDYGIGLLVASAGANNGRTNLAYQKYVEGARNAAGGSVDFESTRWWSVEDSLSNPERVAAVWGFAFLFLEGSQVSKKWEPSLRDYLKRLRESADPAAASKAFDFSRHGELIEDFRKRMKKL